MSAQSAENRRRTLGLKIGTRAQRYFILLEFVLLMSTMVYLLYLIFGTVNDVSGQFPAADQKVLAPIFDQVNYLLLVRISILFLAVFIINVLLGLFYLHRLVGPLVRIKAVLKEIADGNIPSRDVSLRKGDFPTDVADELTRALQKIREIQNEKS